ncbi:UbiA family prenyltransferase [Enterococcus sp. LJL128]|uniref:prenyltransferase n=1 Tax=Enterococcus sp. LJL51 TaxID=3416656 RepID=UPI003CE9DA60
MIKEAVIYLWGFAKRSYTVMEIRTGFATGLPVLSGGLFGACLSGELKIVELVLFTIAGFCFNIIANTANEIRAYIANEENEETFTGHAGSEGLVRGDAKFIDAVLVLLLMLGLGGGSGLLLVWLTKSVGLFVWGVLSVLAAFTYSLGPKPYLLFPVTELVSGFFVGGLSCYLSAYIQAGGNSWSILWYSLISMIFTIFLMSTNNIGDYKKDMGVRRTLPHVIGFRRAILLLIPEAGIMVAAWTALLFIGAIPWWQYLVGWLIFYRQGYVNWYKDYYHIQEVYPEMGREYGPRPLLLIYHFHGWMSLIFLIQLLGGGNI